MFFSPRTRLALAWFCFAVHVLALAAMLFGLQFGLLVGTEASRRAFIAAHPLVWQVGWLAWMPASLGLVLLFLAWADVLAGKTWGLAAVALCFGGAIIDWVDEVILIGVIPPLVARAANDILAAGLFAWWEYVYRAASLGLANGLYSLGGLILSVLAFRTPGFPRWLSWLSLLTWAFSLAISAFGVAGDLRGTFLASAGAFGLFLPWILLLGYRVLQKAPPA